MKIGEYHSVDILGYHPVLAGEYLVGYLMYCNCYKHYISFWHILLLLLSDSFKLTYLKSENQQISVSLSNKDIAWKSDREVKFKNPSGNLKEAFKGYAKPPNWPRPVYELDTNNTDNNGFQNEDFIVWMRTAAFSTFRKLYRKIVHSGEFKNGLPKGEYQLDIMYSILYYSCIRTSQGMNFLHAKTAMFCVSPHVV